MDVQNDAIFEAGDLFFPIILGIYVRFPRGVPYKPGFLEVPSQISILDGPAKYPPPWTPRNTSKKRWRINNAHASTCWGTNDLVTEGRIIISPIPKLHAQVFWREIPFPKCY